MNGQEKMENL